MDEWNDTDLWEAARSTLPRVQRERMESLHHKQQREELTNAELEEVNNLENLNREVVIVRAQAAVLLKQRDYDISDLSQFAPDPDS